MSSYQIKAAVGLLMLFGAKAHTYADAQRPVISGGTENQVSSPTEGVITSAFVGEAEMKADLLQMLANSMRYARNIWYSCPSGNTEGEACGYFKANSAGQNNEDGVRTNADFSMICSFLHKYGQGKVALPAGLTWSDIREMAVNSLVYAYSTHKANKLKATSNNAYWGSVSLSDHVWESSLWAMSVAYSSFFLNDELTPLQKGHVKTMLKAECAYELQRDIPTGYAGDTKAEENGWEADVLACALGLYPDDEMAPQWFRRLREFAVNSYSQSGDATDTTIADPDRDSTTVAGLFKGQNLYDDYTLQNHNYFHTSYQNVVIQELGEAHLALHLFQGDSPKWHTRTLMHNNREVMDSVLFRLALADGELAMPNGNDWSMFLYDQITSYTTAACFLRDPNALLLENLAYKNIKARQTTTADGSWLLNSDIGPRRMGVEGHRVMMTYLMHELASTDDMQPATWAAFSKKYESAHLFTTQNIVRANTPHRFSVFSWSSGLKSYTGYIAPNNPDKNKIIVPYKAHNTGNILGWYTVDGQPTNAVPAVSGVYSLTGNSYTMNGKLTTNGSSLENNFSLYSTPGNAFIYMDYVTANTAATITREQGGLMGISVDPFTKEKRTLYHSGGRIQTDGREFTELSSDWVNIDNQLGILSSAKAQGKKIAFGDRQQTSSILTAKIYPSFSAGSRAVAQGDVADRRHVIYYCNVDSAATAALAQKKTILTDSVPEGWNGLICPDTDGAYYLLLSNYAGKPVCRLSGISMPEGAPVFTAATTLRDGRAEAEFRCDATHSIGNTLRVFVKGGELQGRQVPGDSCSAYLTNTSGRRRKARVTIVSAGASVSGTVAVAAGHTVQVSCRNGALVCRPAELE